MRPLKQACKTLLNCACSLLSKICTKQIRLAYPADVCCVMRLPSFTTSVIRSALCSVGSILYSICVLAALCGFDVVYCIMLCAILALSMYLYCISSSCCWYCCSAVIKGMCIQNGIRCFVASLWCSVAFHFEHWCDEYSVTVDIQAPSVDCNIHMHTPLMTATLYDKIETS